MVLGMPDDFLTWPMWYSLKYTPTSFRQVINAIDDERNRIKSRAGGMGAASRSVISNVVHSSAVPLDGKSARQTFS